MAIKLTEIEMGVFDPAVLREQAVAIRDAMQARSVTATQVGTLFCDLIEACGDVREALRIFLEVNVGEITADIDGRLQGTDEARKGAETAAQKSEATRALVEELVGKLSSQNLYRPTRLEVAHPGEITSVNRMKPRIRAHTLPKFGIGGVLFISDNKALEITPDGAIMPISEGVSVVNVVASGDTSLYKRLEIAVVPPRMRVAGAAVRLDGKGNIRLT